MNEIILPKSSWPVLVRSLQRYKLEPDFTALRDDEEFLRQLGYLEDFGGLTERGLRIVTLILIQNDSNAASAMFEQDLSMVPATQALLQALWGIDDISVDQARMALLFAGADKEEVDDKLTNYLGVLNQNSIIVYNRKDRKIRILVSPLSSSVPPPHIYIDRSRPYSNDLRIREILRECRGSINWLDKYFQKEAFEWILREANAANITNVKILSNTVGDNGLAIKDYKRLKKELSLKGVSLEWRMLPREDTHDLHDRWIFDDGNVCYNIPSVGSINSGQMSELHQSPNHKEIRASFDQYFRKGKQA